MHVYSAALQSPCQTHSAGVSQRQLHLKVMAGSAIKDKVVVVTGANRGLGLEAIL